MTKKARKWRIPFAELFIVFCIVGILAAMLVP